MHATYATHATPRPHAAAIAALLMLMVATAVAAVVASSKRSVNLGPEFTPDGWSVSFRPPRGWRPVLEQAGDGAVEFIESGPQRTGRMLIVQHLPKPRQRSTEELAMLLRREWGYRGFERLFANQIKPRIRARRFGPFPGLQLEDDAKGLIVAVGVVDDRVICFGLRFGGTPLTDSDLRLVDRVLNSVRPAS